MIRKTIFKVAMFNLSLLPLYLILFVQHFNVKAFAVPSSCSDLKSIVIAVFHSNAFILALVVLLVLTGLVALYVFQNIIKYGREDSVHLTNVNSKEFEHLTFVATYVLPLFAYQIKNIQSFIVFVLLLVLIGSLYVKSNWYYLNPVLLFFGYSIYSAKLGDKNVVLIARFKLNKSEVNSRYIDLGNNILFLVDESE